MFEIHLHCSCLIFSYVSHQSWSEIILKCVHVMVRPFLLYYEARAKKGDHNKFVWGRPQALLSSEENYVEKSGAVRQVVKLQTCSCNCRFTTYRHRFARVAPAPRAKLIDSKNRGRASPVKVVSLQPIDG